MTQAKRVFINYNSRDAGQAKYMTHQEWREFMDERPYRKIFPDLPEEP